jgi:peptidoglycan/LPS O-acetylase OafA/YrhL
MPRPSREARRERQEAERLLGVGYGWPAPRRRRGTGRTDAIAAGLAFLGLAVVIYGPERVPSWSELPSWWVPLAFVVAAVLLIAAGRLRR